MTAFGTATEVVEHRGASPIGSPQRHYRLQPPFLLASGERQHDIVVLGGAKGTYAYRSDPDGAIVDFNALLVNPVRESANCAILLDALGYSVAHIAHSDQIAQ